MSITNSLTKTCLGRSERDATSVMPTLNGAIKTIENQGNVTKEMNGGSGGARTRNLCRDRAAL